MLGIPTRVEGEMTAQSQASNHYLGSYFQDSWRVSDNVTLNVGLRFEYETGVREKNDQLMLGFDPNAEVAIAQLAGAAYARNPIPELAVSAFDVHGGTSYASSPGQTGLTWGGQSMWMPRIAGSWSIDEKTVFRLRERSGQGPGELPEAYLPFLIDGVRAPSLNHLNMNVARTVRLGISKTMQFRVDALNVVQQRDLCQSEPEPYFDAIRTDYRQQRTYMRFVTFVVKFNHWSFDAGSCPARPGLRTSGRVLLVGPATRLS